MCIHQQHFNKALLPNRQDDVPICLRVVVHCCLAKFTFNGYYSHSFSLFVDPDKTPIAELLITRLS